MPNRKKKKSGGGFGKKRANSVPGSRPKLDVAPDWARATTPKKESESVSLLIKNFGLPDNQKRLKVTATPDAEINECFENVRKQVESKGGESVCGWQIWEWRKVMVEAEFHAVWKSPSGELVDVTPKKEKEKEIVFIPDDSIKYEGKRVPTKRLALTEDEDVAEWISAVNEYDDIEMENFVDETTMILDREASTKLQAAMNRRTSAEMAIFNRLAEDRRQKGLPLI